MRDLSKKLKLVTIARIVLGAIFASAALSYFWREAFGWPLLPVPVTDRGVQFALSIIRVGYLWPLMKCINLIAGILLMVNRAPAFALALLAPITVVIIWFQIYFNPLPVPLATVVVAVGCELVLVRAYASNYVGMFQRVDSKERERL
jgi:putative oxidoreductase